MASVEKIAAVYEQALADRMGLPVSRRGDVLVVTVQDARLLIQLYENDPEYLRLFGFFEGPGTLERSQLERICATTAETIKCSKARVDDDGDLRLSVELIVAGPDCIPDVDHLVSILPRALSIFFATVQRIGTELEFALITGREVQGGARPFDQTTERPT